MSEEKSAQPVWALGAMSGTSLDGVDGALIRSDGVEIAEFGASAYRAYSDGERACLRAALGRWPGAQGVAEAAQVVEAAHLELLGPLAAQADLVGFHGQTLAHEPQGRGTHQAGDGAALAAKLGRPVAWDFRSADVATGGEGAPLAPVYHWALARWIGAGAPIAFLNLGGVGNLTWVDPLAKDPFAPGAMLAFDTGPANAPINDLVAARRGWAQDQGGALALSGRADRAAVAAALADPYFQRPPPKSLDRDAFPALPGLVAGLSDGDAAATLVAVAAEAVALGLTQCPTAPSELLVTGGGRQNRALMQALAAALPCKVAPVEAHGLDGDMLEAQAFAYLALRAARGLPISGPSTTRAPGPLTGGRISQPA